MGKSAKGGEFERELCVLLSRWWTDNKHEDRFWRTAGSGARAKVRGRAGKSTHGHHGDICSTHPSSAAFCNLILPEIKRGYSKFSVADMLDKSPTAALQEWEKWFLQTRESRKQAGTPFWMIFQRRDRRIPIVFFPLSMLEAIENAQQETFKNCRPFFHMRIRIRLKNIQVGSKKQIPTFATTVVGTGLDAFLRVTKPQTIKDLAKELCR